PTMPPTSPPTTVPTPGTTEPMSAYLAAVPAIPLADSAPSVMPASSSSFFRSAGSLIPASASFTFFGSVSAISPVASLCALSAGPFGYVATRARVCLSVSPDISSSRSASRLRPSVRFLYSSLIAAISAGDLPSSALNTALSLVPMPSMALNSSFAARPAAAVSTGLAFWLAGPPYMSPRKASASGGGGGPAGATGGALGAASGGAAEAGFWDSPPPHNWAMPSVMLSNTRGVLQG